MEERFSIHTDSYFPFIFPNQASETTKERREFIRQSMTGLAEDGKGIWVRLAISESLSRL